MAIINVEEFFNQLNSGAKWDAAVAFNRNNPLPIDASSVYHSLEEAQAYATTATAYPGQIIAVVTTSETSFFGINQAGELQPVGGSANSIIFCANEAEMLALTDLDVGQQVILEDTGVTYFYKSGDPSDINSWVASGKNDTLWKGTEYKVNFYALTQAQYDAIASKDASTLYFITDTGKVCKGNIDVSSDVKFVSEFPASGVDGKLYVKPSTLEVKAYNGTSWSVLSPGYITDGANWANAADSGKLATVAVIKSAIQTAVDEIVLDATFNNTDGTLKVGDGTAATLTGVAHDIVYDATQLKITIPVYGASKALEINIPKDKFVTAGTYNKETKNIELTIEGQAEKVLIPAADIMLKLNSDANNAATLDENGLMVDISGKMDKVSGTSADAGKIAVLGDDGTSVVVGSIKISDIPTAEAVANKLDKITGTENNIVAVATDGGIKDSGKAAGGAALASTPTANTLATEAAVKKAVDDAALVWETI